MREFIDTGEEYVNDKNLQISNLPIIDLEIQGIKIKALIDTGAEVSLINSNLIDENKDKLKNLISISKIKLLNVNGRRFADSNKILNTKIRVLGEEFYGEFVVITNMRFDMILGEDLLTKLRAKIDMGERSMQLNGNKIKIGRVNEVNGERANIGNINNLLNDERVDNKIDKVETSTFKIIIKEIPESYNINCPPKYENKVKNLIIKHNSLIHYESQIAKGYMHKFIEDESKPIRCKSYPIPYNRGQVNNEIENMPKANNIELAKTNYINRLVVVKKKNDINRLCLDARILSQIKRIINNAARYMKRKMRKIYKRVKFKLRFG